MPDDNRPTTKSRLVTAAMQLFLEKGYAATSLQDVLHAADAHPGSLYHSFASKEALLVGVLKLYLDGIESMLIQPAWKRVHDPIDRIFALLASYRSALLATSYRYACPIGSLALEIHRPSPAVRRLLAQNFKAWTAAVERCIRDAGSRISPRADKGELASFVLTVMEGGVMQARTHRDIEMFDGAVRQLRMYFDCLLVDHGGRALSQSHAGASGVHFGAFPSPY